MMQKSLSLSNTGNSITLPAEAVAAPLRHPFELPNLPRVLAAIVLKILEQKFPDGIFSKWSIHDAAGTVFGYPREVQASLLRSDNVTYIIEAFMNCGRPDLAFANRLLNFYKTSNRSVEVKMLIVTMVMSIEDLRKAKELQFDIISYVLEGEQEEEQQPSAPAAPTPVQHLNLPGGAVQQIKGRTRTGSVLWNQVLPILKEETVLPDQFSSWLEFLLACKLPLEVAIEYDARLTAEDLLVDIQLQELKDRAILKALNIKMGHQLKILQTLKRYEAQRKSRGLEALPNASNLELSTRTSLRLQPPNNSTSSTSDLPESLSAAFALPPPPPLTSISVASSPSSSQEGTSSSTSTRIHSDQYSATTSQTPPPVSNSSPLLMNVTNSLPPPPETFAPPPLPPPPESSSPQLNSRGLENRFAFPAPILPPASILARTPSRDGSPSGRLRNIAAALPPPPPPIVSSGSSPSPPPAILSKVGLPPPPAAPLASFPPPPLLSRGNNFSGTGGGGRPVVSSPLAKRDEPTTPERDEN